MKKLLLVLLLAMPGFALDQYSGWCERGNKTVSLQGITSSTLVQQSYPNTGTPSTSCKITVYDHGTLTPSTIYSDNNVFPTPLANPFYVNSDGSWQFFANDGRYDVVGKLGTTAIFSVSDVLLNDAKNYCRASFHSGADLCAKWNSTIADSRCTSRQYDLTDLTGAQSCSADVTLPAGSKNTFSITNVNFGAHEIIIPAGTNNVTIQGVQSGSPSDITHSTVFSSTSTAPIIKVGTSSSSTLGFRLDSIALNISGAGTGAIGGQFNRSINHFLTFVTCYSDVSGTYTGQKCLDLEGVGEFTGGRIDLPYLTTSQLGWGIYSSSFANANTVTGGNIICATGGIGIFLGNTASGGNFVNGTDTEGCAYALDLTSSHNYFRARYESSTVQSVRINAGAFNNTIECTPCTLTNNSANTSNGFNLQDVLPHYDATGSYTQRTGLDSPIASSARPGATTNQGITFSAQTFDFLNNLTWTFNDGAGTAAISDGSFTRLLLTPAAQWMRAIGDSNSVNINDIGGSTGGLVIWDGSSVQSWHVAGSGKTTLYNKIATVANGVPSEHAEVNIANNSGSITTTTLYAVPASGLGMYRVSYYVDTQTPGSAGTVSLTLTWGDGTTTKTFTSATASLTVNTYASVASGVQVIRSDNSQNVTYSTTVTGATGSPTYNVFIRLEAL